ncbi:MAG: preprotein translocase subunit SecE [Xanthomonadales bacterium]|jgi:preprotein translocase subunit SecE|nr:preprotein translocase subunit SecE [Xanthomonadales bacterium]
MNTAQQNPVANTFMLVLAILVVIGGVVGYYLLDGQPDFIRMLAVIGALIVAGFIAYKTQQGRALFDFLKAADLERRKIVWPTRTETLQTTVIIGVVTLIVSFILFGMDLFFSWGVRLLMGGGV